MLADKQSATKKNIKPLRVNGGIARSAVPAFKKVTDLSSKTIVNKKNSVKSRPAVNPFNIQKNPNQTGLPDHLKAGVEHLSRISMDDVRVHYHSDKPGKVNAHAYAQGHNIYVAPGQEKHLPHEAWHVVQQKQGRVKPTMQFKGYKINNDNGLENEATVNGAKALSHKAPGNIFNAPLQRIAIHSGQPMQRAIKLDGQVLETQKDLIGYILINMPQHGYSVPGKLLSECAKMLKDAGLLKDLNGKSITFEEFIDIAADKGLTSTKITSQSVTHKAQKIGKRPDFHSSINEARNKIKEQHGIVVAARHVIPSHLLGYAAEHVPGSADQLKYWVDAQLKTNPSLVNSVKNNESKNLRILRRNIWIILHNHKGNLWVGESLPNSVIGFSSGVVESWIGKIAGSNTPLTVLEEIKAGQEGVVKGDLAIGMQNIKKAIIGSFEAIIDENMDGKDVVNAKSLMLDLAEVWEQIEGDVFSFNLSEYIKSSEFIKKFQSQPELSDLDKFMAHKFGGTMA